MDLERIGGPHVVEPHPHLRDPGRRPVAGVLDPVGLGAEIADDRRVDQEEAVPGARQAPGAQIRVVGTATPAGEAAGPVLDEPQRRGGLYGRRAERRGDERRAKTPEPWPHPRTA